MLILAFLAGAATVAAVVYPLWRALHADLLTAQDRLYGAWQAGATIPPRPEDVVTEPPAPLPEPLRGFVDEWTSPDVRLRVEERIRRMLARGLSVADIGKTLLLERDNQRFGFAAPLARSGQTP